VKTRTTIVAATAGLALVVGGIIVQAQAAAHVSGEQRNTVQAFGVLEGLDQSSTEDIEAAAVAADPTALVTLAKGLQAHVLTAGTAAPNLDMAALWPPAQPQFLLSCNEQGPSAPGVQRISLATGVAETIVTGTTSCDPLPTTPWGTVIFGEEAGDGHVYEMIDPLSITNATLDRITGATSTPKIVRRDALGAVAFEGIGILPNGVTYYGDELAPSNGSPGGSLYRFAPATPWAGGTLTSLANSPFAAGTIAALKVGQGSNTGPGMASGSGTWVPLAPAATTGSLRPGAAAAKATGFYRPEDLSFDEAALDRGEVRFCGNNTGREQARYYGETICVTDGTVATATAGTAVPAVQPLVVGSPALNMPDNIAFQPGRGNWIIHEDGETTEPTAHNNDLWSCLDDGADDDLLSDGRLRIGTLNDLSAEWTGGFFDESASTSTSACSTTRRASV
jgi:secreted PhoX family phosphatase